MKAVLEKTSGPEPETAAEDLKINYNAAAGDTLNRVQQELAIKENEQKVNCRTRDSGSTQCL